VKTIMTIAAIAATLLPAATVEARPAHRAKAWPTTYVCSKCHMSYTASQARRDHFMDPMDGGRLVPVPPKKKAAFMRGHRA
jgi:hypothetical protein